MKLHRLQCQSDAMKDISGGKNFWIESYLRKSDKKEKIWIVLKTNYYKFK